MLAKKRQAEGVVSAETSETIVDAFESPMEGRKKMMRISSYDSLEVPFAGLATDWSHPRPRYPNGSGGAVMTDPTPR